MQELFSKLGLEAQAKRAGEANNETKFILEKFQKELILSED